LKGSTALAGEEAREKQILISLLPAVDSEAGEEHWYDLLSETPTPPHDMLCTVEAANVGYTGHPEDYAMKLSEHCMQLGKLASSLQGLEFALRAFLLKHNEAHEPKVNPATITAGNQVALNSFTNWDTLGQLIDKFNDVAKASCPACCVDRTVVDVRDMIAHGRVAGRGPEPPWQLIKFGKPSGQKVPVEQVVTVDEQWLLSNVQMVTSQLKNVYDASKALGQGIMDLV
jgi:hypothetical protein